MAVDPSIALGVKPLEVANPLTQYAQVAQLQSAQNQNALAQYQLGAAQRADEDQQTIRNAMAGVKFGTPEYDAAVTGAYAKTGNLKGLQEFQKSKGEQEKLTAETDLKKIELRRATYGNLAMNPSDENIKANLQDDVIKGKLTPDQANSEWQRYSQMPLQQRSQFFEKAAMTAHERTGHDITMRGQNLVDARARENINIAKENQRRENDPAFQQQLAEAKALGQNMAKDKVLRAAQLPKVLDTAEMTLREVDDLIGKRNTEGKLLPGQKPHPGFGPAVGMGGLGTLGIPGLAQVVPGTDAADFKTRFDQIKGGAFLQAFETLKGGGSITNVEGDKGTAALNRMSLAQSEKEFVQAAREFQDVVRKGVERANKMAGSPAATPAMPATPVQSVVRLPATPAPASNVIDFGSLK
jgi:hypothetical protein